ncbi:hypothetical protein LAZ67_1008337 [Cordylochernes scorpioides]|uniref:Uncharacterized protein n=1 Tax=Cordylochernes scorpioides TaxID=51811 RepID=A0ABY6K365_9ARAC|nr:hypothetical protein LAZ67_1008337 [Cordylochernes scorpioides]
MREEDTYCHLGVPTRFNKPRNPGEAIKGIKEDVEKINNSLLTTWQKIDATKTFVYTRLDFILRGSLIHKTSFREVDLLIKRLGKKWPGLPLQASNEVLFIPPSKGGAGIHFYTTLSHIYISLLILFQFVFKPAGIKSIFCLSSLGKISLQILKEFAMAVCWVSLCDCAGVEFTCPGREFTFWDKVFICSNVEFS